VSVALAPLLKGYTLSCAGQQSGEPMVKTSPYLINSNRLGDVIGAIQVLGSFPWHAIKKEHWERHFGFAHSPDGLWDVVFEEHPEFFRIEKNGDVALRWRFAYERTYDPTKNRDYTPAQRDTKLTKMQREKLHRRPLGTDQISALMDVAVELHGRALAQAQDKRWKIPLYSSFAGGLLGAILGAVGSVVAALLKNNIPSPG
jgi:hypothetical protein